MPQCDREELRTVGPQIGSKTIDQILSESALRHDTRAMMAELDLRQNTIKMLMRALRAARKALPEGSLERLEADHWLAVARQRGATHDE